jgi:hypothetical protein
VNILYQKFFSYPSFKIAIEIAIAIAIGIGKDLDFDSEPDFDLDFIISYNTLFFFIITNSLRPLRALRDL